MKKSEEGNEVEGKQCKKKKQKVKKWNTEKPNREDGIVRQRRQMKEQREGMKERCTRQRKEDKGEERKVNM